MLRDVLWLAKPDLLGVAAGFLPRTSIVRDPAMLYIAIGILGATVMPHNLYLHSSIIQTRKYGDTAESKREAVRFATIDSTVALMFALFLNGAIRGGRGDVPHVRHEGVADISDAYCWRRSSERLCQHALRRRAAFSGQNATLTGTLAGRS
jgi:manganese transport protein